MNDEVTNAPPPSWLKEGVRVRFAGEGWPRVQLQGGAVGTVRSLDVDSDGNLRWFNVLYDGHEARKVNGVNHYGWHVHQKHVVPEDPQILFEDMRTYKVVLTSPEGEVIVVRGIDITPKGRIVDAGPTLRTDLRKKVHDHEARLGRVWRS